MVINTLELFCDSAYVILNCSPRVAKALPRRTLVPVTFNLSAERLLPMFVSIPPVIKCVQTVKRCSRLRPLICHLQLACMLWTLILLFSLAAGNAAPKTELAEALVVNFDFESALPGNSVNGQARLEATGPNAEHFLGMPASNQALNFQKAGAYLRIADDQDAGPLDFRNGDEITLESWVRIDRLNNNANVYILGKGRTYEHGVQENQNYALRLRAVGSEAKVSFLFSTRAQPDAEPTYHRWTSAKGFAADGMWHHVAVTYQFGDTASIKGYVDGELSKGTWDMGGATKLPPINDNDAVWIGSSRGGDPGNSLVGGVDDVRIYRKLVDASEFKERRKVISKPPTWLESASADRVTIALHPGAGSHTAFPAVIPVEQYRFSTPLLAIHRLPLRYTSGGVRQAWPGPVLLRAFTRVELPAGEIELMLRSPGLTRLWMNGQVVATTPARSLFRDAHQPFIVWKSDLPWLRAPRSGDNEVRQIVKVDSGQTEFIMETLVGSASSRCELGETLVAYRAGDQMFSVLGPSRDMVQLVDEEFEHYRQGLEFELSQLDRQQLTQTSAEENAFWEDRHQLAKQFQATLPALEVPTTNSELPERNLIDRFIHAGLASEVVAEAFDKTVFRLTSDAEFLRRVSLDCVGIPPTADQVVAFEQDMSPKKREGVIEELLADDRWADHWTSYWQDALAENPNILKPSLNNSGPFRWWIHDSLLVNKPLDRFVTELVRMEGDLNSGAAAGFGMAAENDVPMAEKAHILASAFLAVDMKCARCHDAPYHPWSQGDLFSLGAMLTGKAIEVPATSSVPKEFFERKGRESPISISLHPGDKVEPAWPFADLGNTEVDPQLLGRPDSTRERLAAMLTRAENRRFAQVIANRVWTRLLGWGLVSSVDDWEDDALSHANLLEHLAREFIESGYDLKHLVRYIVLSDIYQRRSIERSSVSEALAHAAPWHRRLTAEQLVDSTHAVSGVSLQTEAITFDLEATQKRENFLNLGPASRAWQLTSLSNERDRPSLSLPKAAAVVECMEAFGWKAARQAPLNHRETEPNMVQPGVVANGSMASWTTRFSDESQLTMEALNAASPEQFVERLFLRILNRHPLAEESHIFVATLSDGFSERIQQPRQTQKVPPVHRGFVTWTNHFAVESNELMRQIEREIAAGPEPTQRLSDDWRKRAEDAAWALINAPEFQFIP